MEVYTGVLTSEAKLMASSLGLISLGVAFWRLLPFKEAISVMHSGSYQTLMLSWLYNVPIGLLS